MKVTRAHELPIIDAVLVKKIYQCVKHFPKDGEWRVLTGLIKIKDRDVAIKCDFLLHGEIISIDNLKLTFPEKSLIIH